MMVYQAMIQVFRDDIRIELSITTIRHLFGACDEFTAMKNQKLDQLADPDAHHA